MSSRKEGKAIVWLGLEKVATLSLALFTTVIVARYLGPGKLGVLSSAIAVVAILSPLSSLLIDKALVRRFSQTPEKRDYLLTIARQITTWACAITFIAGILFIGIWAIDGGYFDQAKFVVGLIALVSLLTAPFLVPFRSLCESMTNGRILAASSLSGSLGSSFFRLAMVATGAPLPAFAATNTVSSVFSIAVLRKHFGRVGNWFRGVPEWRAKEHGFISEGTVLAFAALTNLLHRNVDILMVERISGAAEAGNYAASSRLTEITYMIPVILATVFLPKLSRSVKKETIALQFFRLNTLLALGITAGGLLLGKPVVSMLYGSEFPTVGTIFLIHIASVWFIFIDHAKGTVITSKKGSPVVIWSNVIAVTVNVSLNLILIPQFGGIGAAAATFVSYAMIGALLPFCFRETREIAKLQVLALFTPFVGLNRLWAR